MRGSRAPRPAPQSVAPSRRPRDAVLPEGNGLRALPPGDLVVRRLHHLLRGGGALRARQPLPPLHQVRPGWAAGPGAGRRRRGAELPSGRERSRPAGGRPAGRPTSGGEGSALLAAGMGREAAGAEQSGSDFILNIDH